MVEIQEQLRLLLQVAQLLTSILITTALPISQAMFSPAWLLARTTLL